MKINKLALLAIASLTLSISAVAQQAIDSTTFRSGSMTLSECVSFAQQHSPRLLPLSARIQSLELSESTAKQAYLPSVNAGIGENVSFGRSQGNDGIYKSVNSANTSFQIGASWDIFTGGARRYDLKRSQEELKSRDYIVAETKDQIALTIVEDYISVLLAEQMVNVAKENLQLSTSLYEQTKTQVEVGKLPLSQQIQIESQVGQDKLSLSEALAEVERAKRMLLLDMGVDQPTATISIPDLKPEEIAARLDGINPTVKNQSWETPTTRLAKVQHDLAEYDIKRAKAGYLPSLSLNAGYSNGYYYAFGDNIPADMNPAFKEQMKKNGNTSIGVSLNIPIYNKGQVRSQIRQAQIQQLNLQSQLIQQQFTDTRNITLADTELKKATEKYLISIENVRLSQMALEMSEKEYRAGRITAYEWDQARNKYLQAQGNYLTSIYNRLLRIINLSYFNTGELPLHLAE